MAEEHPKPEIEEPDSKKQKVEAPKYTLFGYWRSGASWRVRIAFAFKGLTYIHEGINLLTSQQSSAEYVAKNPQGRVPLLVIDGDKSIAQSLAIIDYLENAHPDTPSLMPKDPYLRAQAISLSEVINADTQPLQNLGTLQRVAKIAGEEAKQEWAIWAITHGLKALESGVSKLAGKYCIGDDVSLVDLVLVPQLSAARRFNIDLSVYPTLIRVDKELSTHPAFIAGHANAQPDKPQSMAPIQ